MKKLFSLLLVSVLTTAIASAQDVPPPPPAPQGDAVPPAPRQEKPAPDATPAERKMSPRKQNFLMWRAFSQLSEEERTMLVKLQREDPEQFRTILRGKAEALFAAEQKRQEELRGLLAVGTSSYWEEHFTFGRASVRQPKRMGRGALDLVIINTVVPFLYAYGQHRQEESLCERATMLLETLKAEDNYITRMWSGAGLPVSTAADSQALIQLQKEYCDRKDCLRCRFGYEYLKWKENR